MKVRTGFVSNSSSSSFTCCICGTTESGMDASWQDWDWNGCEHGHVFCCDELIEIEEDKVIDFKKNYIIKDIKEYIKDDEDEELSEYHQTLKANLDKLESGDFSELEECWEEWTEGATICELECPICQFEAPDYGDLARYLEKKFSIPRDEIFKIVKEKNKRRRKLYDLEYVDIICERKDITVDTLIKNIKEEYKEYGIFLKSLRS